MLKQHVIFLQAIDHRVLPHSHKVKDYGEKSHNDDAYTGGFDGDKLAGAEWMTNGQVPHQCGEHGQHGAAEDKHTDDGRTVQSVIQHELATMEYILARSLKAHRKGCYTEHHVGHSQGDQTDSGAVLYFVQEPSVLLFGEDGHIEDVSEDPERADHGNDDVVTVVV